MFTRDEGVFVVPATREPIYFHTHINPELALNLICFFPGIAPVDLIHVILSNELDSSWSLIGTAEITRDEVVEGRYK
jgi:hypothetical protein